MTRNVRSTPRMRLTQRNYHPPEGNLRVGSIPTAGIGLATIVQSRVPLLVWSCLIFLTPVGESFAPYVCDLSPVDDGELEFVGADPHNLTPPHEALCAGEVDEDHREDSVLVAIEPVGL